MRANTLPTINTTQSCPITISAGSSTIVVDR
jgi:hypothetical protein